MTNYTQYFKTKARNNGDEFTCLTDDAPECLKDLVRDIHMNYFFTCLPNDWVYKTISEAFDLMADYQQLEDFEDVQGYEPDIYSHDLCRWLYENCNAFAQHYCNETLSTFGVKSDIIEMIANGQYEAIEQIHRAVFDFLKPEGGE